VGAGGLRRETRVVERLSDFRVAVLPLIPWLGVDGQIARALDALASRLGRLGCAVKQAQP